MYLRVTITHFILSLAMIISFCVQSYGADKVVVIPLNSKAKAAGTDGQFLYNSGGKIAGTDVYYDKNSGNYGIGIRTIHQDAKLEIGGPTWFWLSQPNNIQSLIIGTPGGWPGIITKTHGKRMDISFHDGFINLAGSINESAPSISSGLTVTNTARVGINTSSPTSTLEVRGEIRSTDYQGNNRLWGKGRPGIITVTDSGQCNSSNNLYKYSVSNTIVPWNDAAQACPHGTWVCTATERGITYCDPSGVSTTFVNCDGDTQDAQGGNYVNIPAWVADADSNTHLEGDLVRLNGGVASDHVCTYRPVWCCAYK